MGYFIAEETLFDLIRGVKKILKKIHKTDFRCRIGTDLTRIIFNGSTEDTRISYVFHFDWEDYDFSTLEMREQRRPDVTLYIELASSNIKYKKVTDKFVLRELLFIDNLCGTRYEIIEDKIKELSKKR